MSKRWPANEVAPPVVTHRHGVRTVAIHRPFGEVATVVVAVPAGELYESTAAVTGAASVLARAIPYGTHAHPSTVALAEAIEGIGGAFGVDAGNDLASAWATVPHEQLAEAARIVVDMATAPLLASDAVERERQVIAGRLRAAETEPSARASELLAALLWPHATLGRSYAAQAEAVEQVSPAAVSTFHQQQFAAPVAVVGASAPIDAEAISALLQRQVERWFDGQPLGPSAIGDPGERFASAPVTSELAYLALGVRAVPYDHPDRYGLNLLAVVLGGGMTSRLFVEVREKRGLCYGIGARITMHPTTGAFTVQAGVPPQRLQEAIAAILEQLRLVSTQLSPAELDRAKAMIRGRLAMESDNGERLVSRYVGDVLRYGQPRLARDTIAAIESMTVDEVARLAAEYLAPERLRLGVAGSFPDGPPSEALLSA